MAFRDAYTQLFPPKPTFTERDLPSQSGKVFIVTGGSTGVGYELCKMLYETGATVYLTSRSTVSENFPNIVLTLILSQGITNRISEAR